MATRAIFWYGCNVLRHGDIIHLCIRILEALGLDVRAAGGPNYCCGTVKDTNLAAAEGMARRTVQRFNELKREDVIIWCPSCHSHMSNFMTAFNRAEFEYTYFLDALWLRREKLQTLLARPVAKRVLVHQHSGFNDEVPVNRRVRELLSLVPTLDVVDDGYQAPSYMCASLARHPPAMRDMVRETLRRIAARSATALVTVYHQCHRELCELDAKDRNLEVLNYVHILAQSMGLHYEDEYKKWKLAGKDAGALIGEDRIARVGVEFYERAIATEFVRRHPTK